MILALLLACAPGHDINIVDACVTSAELQCGCGDIAADSSWCTGDARELCAPFSGNLDVVNCQNAYYAAHCSEEGEECEDGS